MKIYISSPQPPSRLKIYISSPQPPRRFCACTLCMKLHRICQMCGRYAVRGVPLLASVRFGWSSMYPKLAPPSLSASFVRYDRRAAHIWRLENNTWMICRRLDLAKISQRSPQSKIERARQLHFSVRNGRATSNFQTELLDGDCERL